MALKPGDVVSIRQLAGWQDIGSSVTISGEVEHAGSYAIEPGERLSSVLKRAGGFREDAYPPAAVLGAGASSPTGRTSASANDSTNREYAGPGQTGSDRPASSDRYPAVTRDATAGDSREPSQPSRQWSTDHQHLIRCEPDGKIHRRILNCAPVTLCSYPSGQILSWLAAKYITQPQ